jgi:endonuclease YncB( thermonuclease family)
VVHGDTLEIRGERIRLLDVDAPESQQTCIRPDGTEWRCGQEAALRLSDWIGTRTVTCEASRKDHYGRWLAHCESGGEDMARWLASRGWALPYRECKCEVIRSASEGAKSLQRGLWLGTFEMPWEWRKAN